MASPSCHECTPAALEGPNCGVASAPRGGGGSGEPRCDKKDATDTAAGGMYRLAAQDVGQRLIRRSGREGLLATDNAALVPQCVRARLGRRFFSFCTNGDGGCGVHACLGHPNAYGELEYPGGQAVGRRAISVCFAALPTVDVHGADCSHLQIVRES